MVDKTRRNLLKGMGTGSTVAIISLSGCSGDSGDGTATEQPGGNGGNDTETTEGNQQEQVTLAVANWASGGAADSWETLLNNFVDQSDQVSDIDYETTPYEQFQNNMQTRLGAGDAPDVFYVNDIWFTDWASSGVLLNFDEPSSNDDEFSMDEVIEAPAQTYAYQGTQYALPHSASGINLHYNTAMFEQAGLDTESAPESWSELESACESLANADLDIVAPLYDDPNDGTVTLFWTMMVQKGGSVLNDDGSECVIASEENIEALEFLKTLRDAGYIALVSELDANAYDEAIGSQQVAMTNTGWWAVRSYESNYQDVNEDIVADHFPTPEDGERGTVLNSTGLTASAESDNTQSAYELVKYICYGEGAEFSLQNSMSTPPVEHLLDSDYFEEYPRIRLAVEASEYAQPLLYGDHTAQILDVTSSELEAVYLGNKSPQEALETAEETINTEALS